MWTKRAGRIQPADGLDERGWETLASGANRIAHDVREATGLRTVFHHHCATFVETQRQIDEILRSEGVPSRYVEIDSPHGHDAFLINLDQLSGPISEFLDQKAE